MATYYVDYENGDDANAGTLATAPKKTVADVLADYVLGPGDTIWLAPGAHRLAATLNLEANGAEGSPIVFRGDPNCTRAWILAKPGIVRLTRADASEVPQSGFVVDFMIYDYNEFWDMYIDGTNAAAVDGAGATKTHNYLRRCFAQGSTYGASNYINAVDCVLRGATGGGADVSTVRCLGIAAANAFTGGVHDCSIAMAGYNYGFLNPVSAKNCAAFCCYVGAGVITVAGTVDNFYSLSCNWPLVTTLSGGEQVMRGGFFDNNGNNTNSDGHDMSLCRQVYNAINTHPVEPAYKAAQGHCTNHPPPEVWLRTLAELLAPLVFRDGDMLDGAAPTEQAEDAVGRAWGSRFRGQPADRRLVGPFSLDDRGIVYDAIDGPLVTVYRKGEEIYHVPLLKGAAVTVRVLCESDLDGGALQPQVVVKFPPASGTADKVETATGTPHDFSIAIAAGDVPYDLVARVILRGRETTAGAYATFSGLRVT